MGEASPEPPEPTVATLLDRLRQLEQRHLRSILIFDQFEEFFFIYPRPEQRRPFFEFLAGCMQVLSVKVILSLREDYLHFLLECGRLGAIETAGIDILSQNVRYYLGNFSAADTRAIIQDLTKRARFYLEPDLVEQLVQDLASELGEVRPIELQVVGAQLQEDQITTLAQYRALGNQPKETLVERYLQTVVNSCGQENQQVADLVLYLLTDEKGTRPLKTRAELQKELQEFAFHQVGTDQSLDLVLRIFVDSGLVLLLPETPEDRYQLVHDYLAAFIRQQQESRLSRLMAELEQEREQRKQGEAKLNRFLKRALFASVLAGLGLAVLAVTAIWSAQRVEKQKRQIEANEMQILAKSADVLLTSGRTLDALLESFKLVERTEQLTPEATSPLNANSLLQQALFEVSEQNRLSRHNSVVAGVSFSPDGKTIASASWDNTVKLWSHEGRELRTLKGHTAGVSGVHFSPDGRTLASASWDGTVKLWNRNGRNFLTLQGHPAAVSRVRFSPDGKTIASASWDKTIKLWSLAGRVLHTLQGHTDAVYSISFSPDGKTLASASADKTVKLWSLEGRELRTLKGHKAKVYDVRFSPDGKTLASASEDKTVKFWHLDGRPISTFEGYYGLYGVDFSPDGKTIASASFDGTVKLWRLDLDNLLPQACEWLNHYLASHPEVLEELKRCQSPQIIQFAAATLVQEGEDLAFQEKLEAAESRFRKAQAWNPRLTFDVQRKVEEFANRGRAERLIGAGNEQVRQGKVKEALNAYNQAQTLDPDVKISVDNWDELCWYGSLYGFPKEVLFACDKAIALATTAIAPRDNIAYYRDSRGIARAMMGDAKGAMTDFQSYVNWTQGKADWSEGRKRRQGWIESLRRSPTRTPFTEEDLKALRDE